MSKTKTKKQSSAVFATFTKDEWHVDLGIVSKEMRSIARNLVAAEIAKIVLQNRRVPFVMVFQDGKWTNSGQVPSVYASDMPAHCCLEVGQVVE